MSKIRVGIVGYGNVGKGVELAISQSNDMELVAVFTRRSPESIQASVKGVSVDDISSYKDQIDVLFLCGGSATDLPVQGPQFARDFNIVDTFDTHAKIPEYFDAVNEAAKRGGNIALISTGWDPGLFSLNRLLGESILPVGASYTFWGEGVSQGHSDAIRRVEGVKNGIQYTVPIESAVEKVRSGSEPELTTREKHKRVCYIVLEEGANGDKVTETIVNMPNYFSDYDTEVNFISEEELTLNHSGMPHGGFVIRTGVSGSGSVQRLEFQLQLESNPEFTANVMVAYGRGIHREKSQGKTGCVTVFDIPFSALSPLNSEELRKQLL